MRDNCREIRATDDPFTHSGLSLVRVFFRANSDLLRARDAASFDLQGCYLVLVFDNEVPILSGV